MKKHPEYQPKANWILKQTSDLLEGQRMTLRKVKNQVTMLKDDKIIATINDPIVSKLLFEPWLGEVSVDEDLKKKLLGIGQ